MPVSAAGSSRLLYNGIELPSLPVWNVSEYPYACIRQDGSPSAGSGSYDLFISSKQFVADSSLSSGSYGSIEGGNFLRYGIPFADVDTSSVWNYVGTGDGAIGVNEDVYPIVWCNIDILNFDGSIYLAATDPVDPNAPTGTLEILSSQILDDSASFVISVSDLASTESIYSIKAVLSSAGTEVKSTVTDTFAGTSSEMHLTVANLEPETAYDISFILQKNGTDTTITASTSFTTLAGSGAGEGETPDYTGQLNEIQISVDNVGTKLDGVQETLTETKEEITSLPEKIATSITEGVKGLFIPSQEDLTAIKDEYEDMLSEKLGFIWQAYDLLTGFISDLQTNLESGEAYEFTFPGIKLPMQGEEFVLVAETPVSLENELMDVLRPVLGTIVSIICVTAFVNMAHDYVLAIISGVSAYQFERRKD